MANQLFTDDSELVVKIGLYKSIFLNIAQFRRPVRERDNIAKRCRYFNKNCSQKNYSFRICNENSSKEITVLKLEPSLIELRKDLCRFESFDLEFGIDKVKILGYRFSDSVLHISNLFVEFGVVSIGNEKLHATELTQLMKHDKKFLWLGDFLAPDDIILHERNTAVNEIVNCIEQSPNISVDRVVVSGSTGRNTNIGRQFDYDLVLFVNDIEPPYEESVIKEILRIVKAKHGLAPSFDYSTTPFCVKLNNWRGTEMDILCAPNLSSDPNVQWTRAVEKMRTLAPKEQRYWLTSVAEKAVDFMKKLDVSTNRLARVVKFMVLGWAFAARVFSKSYAIELLAVHASRNMISMGVCVAKFLELVTDVNNLQVSFSTDTHQGSGPHLMDPANPFNNLHRYLLPHKADFGQFAKETLTDMKAGCSPFRFLVSKRLIATTSHLVANWNGWIVSTRTDMGLEECTPIEDNCSRDLSRAEYTAIHALHSLLTMNIYSSTSMFQKAAENSIDEFREKVAGVGPLKTNCFGASWEDRDVLLKVILPRAGNVGPSSKFDAIFITFNLNNMNPASSGKRNVASASIE